MINYSGQRGPRDKDFVYNSNTIYRLHYATMLVDEYTTASDYRIVRPSGTNDTLFFLTLSGRGRIVLNGRTFTLRPNSLAILAPNTPHDYGNAPGCKTWRFQWTHVRAPAVWEPFLDFAHRFSSAFGVSPQVYVESCRLEYAKRILETKDISIKEAALDAGFTDPLDFSKCFRRAFGVTPSSIAKTFAGKSKRR